MCQDPLCHFFGLQYRRQRVGQKISINFLKSPAIIGNSANRGGRAAYELLGLTPAPKVKSDILDQGKENLEASTEVFGEYVGDYLLMMVTEGTGSFPVA